MKLLNLLKKKKNRSDFSKLRNTQSRYSGKLSYSKQTVESQLFLKNIQNRRRGIKTPRTIFRKHHGFVRKLLILIFLIGILIYLGYRFNLLDYFKISSIRVEGANNFVNIGDVRSLSERNSLGQSVFFFNTNDLAETLSKNFLGAKSINVEKDYPKGIIVYIEERVPLAIVYNKNDENFLIDSEGYVLGVVDKYFLDLPRIKYEGYIIVGTFLEKEIIPVSIEIIEFSEKEELKISSMSFYPNHARIYIERGPEVYIDYKKDRQMNIKTINSLIKKSLVEGSNIKKIDLRYDKVIVLYD